MTKIGRGSRIHLLRGPGRFLANAASTPADEAPPPGRGAGFAVIPDCHPPLRSGSGGADAAPHSNSASTAAWLSDF